MQSVGKVHSACEGECVFNRDGRDRTGADDEEPCDSRQAPEEYLQELSHLVKKCIVGHCSKTMFFVFLYVGS